MIDVLFTQPFTKVKHLTESKIYAENTAREYLNKLCDMQVLDKKELDGHHCVPCRAPDIEQEWLLDLYHVLIIPGHNQIP